MTNEMIENAMTQLNAIVTFTLQDRTIHANGSPILTLARWQSKDGENRHNIPPAMTDVYARHIVRLLNETPLESNEGVLGGITGDRCNECDRKHARRYTCAGVTIP